MTQEEIKTKEALAFLGYNCDREVTSKELYFSYLGLSNRYNPETCVNDEYKDGEAFKKLNECYDYLKNDICRVNETIRNILDPQHKTYVYQKEKPQEAVKPEPVEAMPNNQNMNQNLNPTFREGNIMIADKPSFFGILLSILIPIYGIINYFIVKRVQPRASKWYLLIGIIGLILNMLLMFSI